MKNCYLLITKNEGKDGIVNMLIDSFESAEDAIKKAKDNTDANLKLDKNAKLLSVNEHPYFSLNEFRWQRTVFMTRVEEMESITIRVVLEVPYFKKSEE